jgi:hypothetical protein
LEEQVASRKIAFIEKRLENLYYPLMDILKTETQVSTPDLGLLVNLGKRGYRGLYPIENIIPYQYLATSDLKSPLNDYMEMVRESNPKELQRPEIIELYNHVEEIVEKDVEDFKKQLTDSMGIIEQNPEKVKQDEDCF